MNSRLEVFQQDLTAVSGQLSTLRQMIEAMTARNDKHDEKLSTIEVSLGAVQGQMADLLERVNLGQTELTEPEETLTGTPIGVDSTPTEEEDTGENGKTRQNSEACSRDSEEGAIDSPSSSNPDGGLDHSLWSAG